MVRLREEKGITLIELLVVVAVITVLAISLGFEYSGWVGNYKNEKQTKDLYGDLMEARVRALTRNLICFAVLEEDRYQIFEDTNNSGANDAADTPFFRDSAGVSTPKRFEGGYQLTRPNGGALPVTVTIDTRGLMFPQDDFWLDRNPAQPACCRPTNTCGPLDSMKCIYPDYDCILVTQARIRMGKYDGTDCKEK